MSNKNSYLPYGCQTITEADINSVVEILRSPLITQGPTVPKFEQKLAEKVKAQYGVAVNSATSALHIACMALKLGPGDRLWTSPITFVASANCGHYCGAQVDFVDIDPTTGLMSMVELEKKLEEAKKGNKLPKVVIPVHLAGSSCDMKKINLLANKYGFSVIEDASHAIGGQYLGEPVGCCKYSDITVFSFHPVKIITTGEGGMATTNNPLLAREMQELRSHGIVKEKERFLDPVPGPWAYEQQKLGYNYRMNDIQGALGFSQLDRLDYIVEERNQQLKYYRKLLNELPITILEIPKGVRSAVHLAVVQLQKEREEKHIEVFKGMRNAGIGVQLHYGPVHLQHYYRKNGFREGDFPEAEKYGKKSFSIPLFLGLEKEDQKRVARELEKLLC